jgi:ribosomal protein S18 acetylase RimI-like enzyme
MSVSFIRVGAANGPLLDTIAPDVFDHPVRPDYLADFLGDPRHLMFVAIEAGVVVGMATAFEYFHPDKPPQLFINEVGVSPAWQKRGIGRELTARLVAESKRRGCQYAWLGTETDNLAAQRCFASVPDVEAPKPFLLYEWDSED